jgi:hypothetical protein
MANGFKFVSPSVQFKEVDLTIVQKSAGITKLGVVAEFPKGPAFEAVKITDKNELRTRFGDLNPEVLGGQPRYQGSYVANAFLEESKELYVARVLGLSGYDAGKGWAITLSAGVNLSTTASTNTITIQTGVPFTNNTFNGETIDTLNQTGQIFTGFTKITSSTFRGYLQSYTATTITGSSGTLRVHNRVMTGTSYTTYENMVLAIIRSRADVADVDNGNPTTTFKATTLTIINNTTDDSAGDLFSTFTLRAVGTSTEDYVVSLNPDSRDYIVNVIGNSARGGNSKIYVESIFPDLIKKLDGDRLAYGVVNTPVILNHNIYKDYKSTWTTPETPFVVSELRGNSVARLFKFISISDGDSANREIKISFENINPSTKEFDVMIRDFNDTDDRPVYIETFKRCSMRKSLNNYIGKRIGTLSRDFTKRSSYVCLELDDNAPEDAFPAGFEGYDFRSFASGYTSTANVKQPKIFYKQSYSQFEKPKKVYLGISENGYDGSGVNGSGFNPDLFKFYGAVATGFTKTKGFHMDSGATGTYVNGNVTIGQFEVGAASFKTTGDITNSTNAYFNAVTRKFTFVPYGGFDGWNEHRIARTNGDLYALGQAWDGVASNATSATNDYQAWSQGLDTFSNSENPMINLFTTPGINWSDNLSLVRDSIELIENRADSLYIVDSPRLVGSEPEDVVDLLDTADLDSSYAATYFPWIQISDQVNNKNIMLPPTLEVCKSIAFNDNIAFPWYAPAGLTRGVTDAVDADETFSLPERDVLYDGRINPMAKFNGTGIAIWGQKTLQVRESALDRINVRRLILELKVLITNVAIRLIFEQNDQVVIDQFLAKVNPLLDSVKRERGLQEFKVVMDTSNNSPESRDRNELYGKIMIKPTKSVEFIGLEFNISPSGASFADQ